MMMPFWLKWLRLVEHSHFRGVGLSGLAPASVSNSCWSGGTRLSWQQQWRSMCGYSCGQLEVPFARWRCAGSLATAPLLHGDGSTRWSLTYQQLATPCIRDCGLKLISGGAIWQKAKEQMY